MSDPDPMGAQTAAYNIGAGNKWTFEDPKVRRWVENRLSGRVLNACAGNTRLRHGGEIVTNDLNDELDVDYHKRVRDLPEVLEHHSFDTIIYDPPWSVFQSNEEYGGRMVGKDRIMAEAINKLLTDNGRVIGFGYQSTIMPGDLGYRCDEIAVFRVHGRIKDFFGVVDTRTSKRISSYD